MTEENWEFDLSKIHRANLDIMKAIREICDRHHITYLIDSGTLLGAVRHKGFIPWDHDVDLVFRREEFERFKMYADTELPETMELICPDEYQGGNAFYDFVPRVLYLPSRRHAQDDADMEFYDGKLNHLWVDLFILDHLPENRMERKWMHLLQQIAFGFGMGHRRKLDFSKYHGIQKLEVAVLSGIGHLIPMKTIFHWQKAWASKYTVRFQKYGSSLPPKKRWSFFSNYQPDFQYCEVKDSWEEPIEFDFAGEKFTGPHAWDKILHMLYGDYMKLPPEEKRVPSHSGREIEVLDS